MSQSSLWDLLNDYSQARSPFNFSIHWSLPTMTVALIVAVSAAAMLVFVFQCDQ